MEAGDGPAERFGQGRVDPLRMLRKHRVRIEPAHLQGVVDHLARAVQRKVSAGRLA